VASLKFEFTYRCIHSGIPRPRQVGHIAETTVGQDTAPHAGVVAIGDDLTEAAATVEQTPALAGTFPCQRCAD
jgi:hypothetical protein